MCIPAAGSLGSLIACPPSSAPPWLPPSLPLLWLYKKLNGLGSTPQGPAEGDAGVGLGGGAGVGEVPRLSHVWPPGHRSPACFL